MEQSISAPAFWLAWSQIPGIGPVLLKRLDQQFGSLELAWAASPSQLAQVEGLGTVTIEKIISAKSGINPAALWHQHHQHNPQVWTPADPAYPQILWEIPDPPPLLYWAGSFTDWDRARAIAIVGTRESTSYGRRWARKIAQTLSENGYVIVSGLADGIDAEAHKGSLEASGRGIAVVGTGVDRVYPSKNQPIYQQLLQRGLVLSEYPQGTGPERSHFPQRNRIIAGLCRATILIEAGQRSGALITAYQANDYGREVFALPNSLDYDQSRGCLEMIQRGAQIILGLEQLLTALAQLPQIDPVPALAPVKKSPSRSPAGSSADLAVDQPTQAQVLGLLNDQDLFSFDQIVDRLNLGAGEVSAALLQLELSGLVTQHPGMRYQRIS
ncbi:MAG: DNA-processing protein DprA [Pseudanabaenaceae cyanobacterium bins.68]|nr:DNA-processing protein DprA [Pseudanabaenaceae cyanobacterium bins.68]